VPRRFQDLPGQVPAGGRRQEEHAGCDVLDVADAPEGVAASICSPQLVALQDDVEGEVAVEPTAMALILMRGARSFAARRV